MTEGGPPAPGLQALALEAMDQLLLIHEEGRFRAASPVPSWFAALCPGVDPSTPFALPESAIFLRHFLHDAQAAWADDSVARVDSGPWIETNEAGLESAFEATALSVGGRAALLISRRREQYEEARAILQEARRFSLTNEALERAVRERTATIRQREEEIALRLITLAESRDRGTGEHVQRIGTMAQAMAIALGCPPHLVSDMWLAAAMHDVGKVGIPDHILLKPGALTPEEMETMRAHTLIGRDILSGSRVPLLLLAGEIAHHHHERYDGTGYPDGLEGEQISLSSRIVAVADVYDALVTDRPYRPKRPVDEALKIMVEERERHFDPRVLDAFLELQPTF